eukprot:757294-Hanusia_phi.AAC.1
MPRTSAWSVSSSYLLLLPPSSNSSFLLLFLLAPPPCPSPSYRSGRDRSRRSTRLPAAMTGVGCSTCLRSFPTTSTSSCALLIATRSSNRTLLLPLPPLPYHPLLFLSPCAPVNLSYLRPLSSPLPPFSLLISSTLLTPLADELRVLPRRDAAAG